VDRFVSKFNRLQNKDVAGVSEETLAILMEHDYPGNVRELENIIEHAFVLCRGGLIEPHHLPPSLRGEADIKPMRGRGARTLKALEAMHIADAVRRHGGHRTAAAKELGIDPSTLFRKVKSLGLKLPEQPRRRQSKNT
jgi:transcriptional regulator with PAS, ATPase and Fis domain